MSITLKPDDTGCQVSVYYGDTLVGTLYTNGVYLDYTNELSRKDYNVLTIEKGAVINEVITEIV